MNNNEKAISLVYVDGMPKVFSETGEEITQLTDVILMTSAGQYNTVQITAICNVFSSIAELRLHTSKNK